MDALIPAVVVVVMLALALVALWLLMAVAAYALVGAAILFGFAGEQGFVGIAAYIACWVFLFPVMLVASIVVGLVGSRSGAW